MVDMYKADDYETKYKDKKVKVLEIFGYKYEVVHKDRAVLNNKFSIYVGFILYLVKGSFKRVIRSNIFQKIIMFCFCMLVFGLIFMWRCSDIIDECIDDGYYCELVNNSDTCVKIYEDYISLDSISYNIDNIAKKINYDSTLFDNNLRSTQQTIYQNLSNCIKNHNTNLIYESAFIQTFQFFFSCAILISGWIAFLYICHYMSGLTYKLANHITNKICDTPYFYPDVV